MSVEWYVLKNEEWQGPFTAANLKSLASSQRLSKTDQVRKGNGNPVLAGQVKGLFSESAPKENEYGTIAITRLAEGSKTRTSITVLLDEAYQGELEGTFLKGEQSLTLRVQAGRHVLDLRAAGKRQTSDIEVGENQVVDVETYITKGEIFCRVVPNFSVAAGEPASDSDAVWYYQSLDGQQMGPVSKTELRILALSKGRINRKTLVYRKGMDNWQMVADVAPEVFNHPVDYRTFAILSILPESIRSKAWVKIGITFVVMLGLMARCRGRQLEREKYRQRAKERAVQQQTAFPSHPTSVFLAEGGWE